MTSDDNWPSHGLPAHWNYGVTIDGRIFFIDDQNETTTWLHPSFHQPVQSGYYNDFGLPRGWQFDVDDYNNVFYINHNDRSNTYNNPGDVATSISHANLRHLMESPAAAPEKEVISRKSSSRKSSKKPMAQRDYNQRVDMQGWIKRMEGTVIRQWKKRWFVLSNYSLFCYKEANEYEMLSSYILPGYLVSICFTEPGVPKKASFKIEHKKMKPVYLACDDTGQMFQWIEALRGAANNNNNNLNNNMGYNLNSNGGTGDDNDVEDTFRRSSSLGRERKVRESRVNNSLSYRNNKNKNNDNNNNNSGIFSKNKNNNDVFGNTLNSNKRNRSYEHIPIKSQAPANRNNLMSHQDQNQLNNNNKANNNNNKQYLYGEQRSRTPVYRPSQQQDLTIDRRSSKRSLSISHLNHNNNNNNNRNSNVNNINNNLYNNNNNSNYSNNLRSSSSRNNNRNIAASASSINLNDNNQGDLLLQQQQLLRNQQQQQQLKTLQSNRNSLFSYRSNHAYNNGLTNGAAIGEANVPNDTTKNNINNTNSNSNYYPNNYNDRSHNNMSRNSNKSFQSNKLLTMSNNNNNNNMYQNNYNTNNNTGTNNNRNSHLSFHSNNLGNKQLSKSSITLQQQHQPRQTLQSLQLQQPLQQQQKQQLLLQQQQLHLNNNDNNSIISKPSFSTGPLVVRHTLSNNNSNENINNYNKYNNFSNNDTRNNNMNNNNIRSNSNNNVNNSNDNFKNYNNNNKNNNYNYNAANNNTNNTTNNNNKNRTSYRPVKPPHTDEFYNQLNLHSNNSSNSTLTNNNNYNNNLNKSNNQNNPNYNNFNNNTINNTANYNIPNNPSNMDYLNKINNNQPNNNQPPNHNQPPNNNHPPINNDSIRKTPTLSLNRSLSSFSNRPNNNTSYNNKNNIYPVSNNINNDINFSNSRSNINTKNNMTTASNNFNHNNITPLQPLPQNFSAIREEPGMSDAELQPSKNLQDLKRRLATHTRLRLSISVQDLMGRSYEELVLFLIQLKRSQSELKSTCDLIRSQPITTQHNIVVERQLVSVERQMEATQPLINLLDNMLMMSSLYNGDALMYVSQYKQNQLPQNELKAAKPILEFNRSRQELEIGKQKNNNNNANNKNNNISRNVNSGVDADLLMHLEDEVKVLRQLEEEVRHLDTEIESCQQNRIMIEGALQEIQEGASVTGGGGGGEGWEDTLQRQKKMFESDLDIVYKDLFEKHKIMEDVQNQIKRTEQNIEDIKQNISHNNVKSNYNDNNSNDDNKNRSNDIENHLEEIKAFLQGSSQQKNSINNNLFSLKRSKSNAALDAQATGTYMQTDLDTDVTYDVAIKDDVMMESDVSHGRESRASNISNNNLKQRAQSVPKKEFADTNNNLNSYYNNNYYNDINNINNNNPYNDFNNQNNNIMNNYSINNKSDNININNNNNNNINNIQNNKYYNPDLGNRGLLVTEMPQKPSVAEIRPVQKANQNSSHSSFVTRHNNNINNDFDFNANTIENTLFGPPPLVEIPQRYVADKESEVGGEDDDALKEEKLEQVRKLVAVHSLQDFSLDELGRLEGSGGVAERYQKELEERESILEKKRHLAELVTERSRDLAGGRPLS